MSALEKTQIVTETTVLKAARLAALSCTEVEARSLAHNFSAIKVQLDAIASPDESPRMETIASVRENPTDVDPLTPLREDVPRPFQEGDAILAQAATKRHRFFSVPAPFEKTYAK